MIAAGSQPGKTGGPGPNRMYLGGGNTTKPVISGGGQGPAPRPMPTWDTPGGGQGPAPRPMPTWDTPGGGQGTPSGGGQFAGGLSGQSTIKPPKYIDINDTEDSVNNTLAAGMQAGDKRYQVKQMDRAGVSRGKGQQAAASVQSAKEMAAAANQAAETRAQDQKTNSQMRADYEKARESEALAIAGAQFGINYGQMQAQLAMQQSAMNLMQSLMRP